MPSERTQRHIERLLDEADRAMAQRDWGLVRQHVQDVLDLDPENADARDFLAAMERKAEPSPSTAAGEPPALPDGDPVALRREPITGDGQDARAPGRDDASSSSDTRNPRPETRPVPSPTADSLLPTAFVNGRYTVKRFLGEGGKKKVYLAYDNNLDRDVAFALIKSEGLDDVGRQRISREGQAMGRLGSHPHIVTVFDLGELPATSSEQRAAGNEQRAMSAGAGQPYMVTELMGGGDVEGLLAKSPEHRLPLPQALTIAEQVCQGLEYAHAHGIVHRDLKPGNVWLTEAVGSRQSAVGEGTGTTASSLLPTASLGTAKIGDFGLAVAVDRTRLTQAGMMVGTVSYMPPEQATGGAVTPRSDLYSLGAMLYEMVAGQPPFIGDESVAIIGQHLNVAPVSPAWHRHDCAPGLEALILRLLEKDPNKRPGSATEVRAALSSIAQQVRDPSLPQGARGSGSPPSLPSPREGEGPGMRDDARARHDATAALDNPLYRRVFVGREAELRQLQTAFDQALSGQGGLVMVVGEPGIGKTALVEQLATYATLRSGSTLWGHCYEIGDRSLPYLAFVEALRSCVTARPAEALRVELGSAASDLARIVSEVRERLAIEPRPPSEPEEDRWRLLQAVSGFLRNASSVQPLVIVLEDLHWADQGTLDLLTHLARNLSGARLLVIGTYRDVEVDRSHPLSAALADLRRQASFGRVQLRGLGTPEVQRMLAAITGRQVPGSLAEAIHRQTEGNPLFVQEVVRYLVEEGKLSAVSGQPSAAGPQSSALSPQSTVAVDMAIPEGLRDVIGRRLSRLSPACNRLLAVAAVIGRDFGLDTLQTIAGLEEEAVISALEEALHVGVLEEQSRLGVIRYRFAHAFFRQTLYEELIAPRRLRLHQQVAAALERQYSNRLEEHAAELAEHFAQSTDREDLAKAVRYSELAAARATGVYAYGEAVRHLEQALAVQEVLDPDDTPKRCDQLLALGDVLLPAGQPQRAYESIAPLALELADGMEDRPRASLACRLALEALRRYGARPITRTPVYLHWAELSGRYAEPGTAEQARAEWEMGTALIEAGLAREGWVQLFRALALSRELGEVQTLVELVAAFLTHGRPEDLNEGKRLADELVELPHAGVSTYFLLHLLWRCGIVFLNWGERDRAERLWREMAELEGRTRDAAFGTWVREVWLATLDGRLEEAAALLPVKQAQAEAAGTGPNGRVATYGAAVRIHIYLGRREDMRQMVEVSGDLQSGNPGGLLFLAHLGHLKEALDLLRRLLAERRLREGEDESVLQLTVLLEAATMVADRESVARLAERLVPAAAVATSNGGQMPTLVARHLGAAAALLGDREQALRYSEQALDLATQMRHRPEIALAHLQIAELLLDEAASSEQRATSGDGADAMNRAPTNAEVNPGSVGARHAVPSGPSVRDEALRHLDIAIAELRDMKMQPALERALRHKEVLKA